MSTNPFTAPAAGMPGGAPAASAAPDGARLPRPLGDEGKSTPIGFGRLLSVELRKQLDTRAGKWLMGVTAVLIVLISAILGFTHRDHVSFSDLLGAAVLPMNFLIPILGIMAVTSEWSQRTGLVTFTLEPRRSRIAMAKMVSAIALAIVATVIAFISAAVFTALMGAIGSGSPDWHLDSVAYVTIALGMALQAAIGVAFGLAIQNTPAAICAFLFIPIAVSMLNLFPAGHHIAAWIDPSETFGPLWSGEFHGNDWAKFVVTLLIWLVLPLVIGMVRLNKREVKSA